MFRADGDSDSADRGQSGGCCAVRMRRCSGTGAAVRSGRSDCGGGMLAMAIVVTVRHTAELYRRGAAAVNSAPLSAISVQKTAFGPRRRWCAGGSSTLWVRWGWRCSWRCWRRLNRVTAHYLLATAVAIEITLLHNFAGHVRSRGGIARKRARGWGGACGSICRMGLVSMAGNLALMPLLVGRHGCRWWRRMRSRCWRARW